MVNKPKRSILTSSEDYWAIWLGATFLLFGIVVYVLIGWQKNAERISSHRQKVVDLEEHIPFHTVLWYQENDKYADYYGSNTDLGKSIKSILTRPKTWKENPLHSFVKPEVTVSPENREALDFERENVAMLEQKALELERQAANADYADQTQNEAARLAAVSWYKAHKAYQRQVNTVSAKEYNLLPGLCLLAICLAIVFGIGAYFMGHGFGRFALGFLGVFLLACLAYFLSAQSDMKDLGISYAVWAIVIGLVISNTIRTPSWIKPSILTEYYIKTGLVLLGAEILLSKIMAIGLPGIFVAWFVTPIVLITSYWFGQKVLKISSKTLNITISADMSVCGVSAAIATAAACNAKKEELTLAVGLSMVFTSIMMILMPAFINAVGIPEVLGGAWIGGTIDATGAVVAAGAFLGPKALKVAATIKMIQNVLIGAIAFGVAIYWSVKVENKGKTNVGVGEIWKRFPKFVIGFLGASLIFSFLYAWLPEARSETMIEQGIIRGFSKDLRGWLFCLAFVSIGLSINFKSLKGHFSGGKPLILYICGQSFNLMLTILMAYLMFYVVFPEITELI